MNGFIVVAVAVGIIGAGIAIYADGFTDDEKRTLRYEDAAREIGGALVAGSVIAGLVVWFEHRRESERVTREEWLEERRMRLEEERETRMSEAAWRREIDVPLLQLVQGDLSQTRSELYDRLVELVAPSSQDGTGARMALGKIRNVLSETGIRVQLLGDDAVQEAYDRWWWCLVSFVGRPGDPEDGTPDKDLWVSWERDQRKHDSWAASEHEAWEAMHQALNDYRRRRHPGGGELDAYW